MRQKIDMVVKMDYMRKLRGWYLARLRKSALADETVYMATPAALVDFDREAIKTLVQSETSAGAELIDSAAAKWTRGELLSLVLVCAGAVSCGLLVMFLGSF